MKIERVREDGNRVLLRADPPLEWQHKKFEYIALVSLKDSSIAVESDENFNLIGDCDLSDHIPMVKMFRNISESFNKAFPK